MSKILLIDDDRVFCHLLIDTLVQTNLEVKAVYSANEAIPLLKTEEFDLILLDVYLPDASGVELVTTLKSQFPDLPIIMVSASGETQNIVAAMKNGASDYVRKPFEPGELLEKINALLQIRKIRKTEQEIDQIGTDNPVIGKSIQTRLLIREITKVAISDATVLLRGESGTGKSLIAEVIKNLSQRKTKPFVTLNCAAIPANLLESELFGHEKGAFTGAIREKPGKFEVADEGTLFMDEVGELPPELQVKLLRVLQSHEFERVGGVKTLKVNVRVIAATNRNLEQAIQEGQFREDLFYRLNVLPIYIPPLRERKEDIPLLVDYFVGYFSRKTNKHFGKVSEGILQHLMSYTWPGNIRELQNVIERAIVLGKEPNLHLSDFTLASSNLTLSFKNKFTHYKPDLDDEEASPVALSPLSSLKTLEKSSLTEALQKTRGNITLAAKDLGISRGTIYRRLKKHEIGLKH